MFGVSCFAAPAEKLSLGSNDVVATVGGTIVVQELEACHLESLLTVAFHGRGVRFRNMGWEGDTVFAQPRDVGFPGVGAQLHRFGATVIFVQFGQMESLAGRDGLASFASAYEKFCDELAKQSPQLVLVTPILFEKTINPLVPDLSSRNEDLRLYVNAIREIANRRGWLFVDLYSDLGAGRGVERLTENGFLPTPRGQALVALATARQLGLANVAASAGKMSNRGEWASPTLEALRQAVIAKNRLWFNYWRPMNWAFLGGDRTSQPSSRDHHDPNVRWFPVEMEEFVPMIEAKEREIAGLASRMK